MKNILAKFNNMRIKLYNTDKFREVVNTDYWIRGLKTSKWYGPFQSSDKDDFDFHSVTDEGLFDGLKLSIKFDSGKIFLNYLNGKG